MILLTGAAGHLGANLVRRLIADGERLRVMLHTDAERVTIEGLPVEVAVGDLRDASFVAASTEGCRQIYHCAARVSTTYNRNGDIYGINVLGTRNLLKAAQATKVEKVVVTGSFSSIGIRMDRPSNEDDPYNPLEPLLPRQLSYWRTKAAVEHECLKAHADGLPVVIAVSTGILGPNDFVPSRMGRLLIRFARGQLWAYMAGGVPFVAADDIVQGHVLAMRKGRPGQRYIFATVYKTLDELMLIYSRVTGRSGPLFRLPPALMTVAAHAASTLMPYVNSRGEQLLTPAAVRLLALHRRADTSKAQRELGFRPSSIENAVEQAYDWFVTRGVIEPPHTAASRSVEAWR